jgi:outer membrane protein assembly factor BamB
VIWQRDLVKEYNGTVIRWRSAASPVLDGELLFINAGGSGQAFLAFRKDGSLAWKTGNDLPTHSSPVPATIHGVRQVIFFTESGLVSLSPENGTELWRYAFPFVFSAAMSPIVWKDIVYCSAGYGVGAGACRVTKTDAGLTATEIWRHPGETINQWTTPVCKDGYLYGIFGFKELGTAPLKCIEIATGKELWSQPGFGSGGATILADNHMLVQGDQGTLVLVEATPKAYKEVARAQVLGGKCWTMPVISNRRIYARNTKSGICLDVSEK